MQEMKAWEPTTRDKLGSLLQDWLERVGVDRYSARRKAQTVTGGASSALPLGLGISDAVPGLGYALGAEEGARAIGDGMDNIGAGNVAGGALQAALGGLALVPGGRAATAGARNAPRKAGKAGKAPAGDLIADWQWRPLDEVRADLRGLERVPKYITDGYGNFMVDQAKRAKAGDMGPRDLIKAYGITRSSVNRAGRDITDDIVSGLGVRPEGYMAEWLMTPAGKSYLDAAERGRVDPAAVGDIVRRFQPFGMAQTLGKDLEWAAANLPQMSLGLNDALLGDRGQWREFAQGLHGIGPAKSGFLPSMLGRGDLPTLDARQLRLQTGAGGKEAAKYMSRRDGLGGDQAVDRLAERQTELGLALPRSMRDQYQHLTHHAIWDKVADSQTTHADIVKAMTTAGILGGTALGVSELTDSEEVGAAALAAGVLGVPLGLRGKRLPYGMKSVPLGAGLKPSAVLSDGWADGLSGPLLAQASKYRKALEESPAFRRREMLREQGGTEFTEPAILAPERLMSPEDLYRMKAVLVPVAGDTSLANRTYTKVNGVPLSRPVEVQGGFDYGRTPFAIENGLGWASQQGPAQAKQNNFDVAARETGRQPVGVGFAMNPADSINFSTPVVEMIGAQLDALRPTKEAKRMFNKEVAKKGGAGFVGIDSPDFLPQMLGIDGYPNHGAGALRKAVAQAGSMKGIEGLGFASYDDIRDAMTSPLLRSASVGDSGLMMFSAAPGAPLVEGANHNSYSHGIQGKYLGGLGVSIPGEVFWQRPYADALKKKNKAGNLFSHEEAIGDIKMGHRWQVADQQWLDSVMPVFDELWRLKRLGIE